MSAWVAETENVWMKTDRFSLGVGIFFVSEDTEVTLSGDLGPGTPVDFQDDLGPETFNQPFIVCFLSSTKSCRQVCTILCVMEE